MDLSGCGGLRATDGTWYLAGSSPALAPCATPLLGWVVPMALIALLRNVSSALVWRSWWLRHRGANTRRLPLYPLFACTPPRVLAAR